MSTVRDALMILERYKKIKKEGTTTREGILLKDLRNHWPHILELLNNLEQLMGGLRSDIEELENILKWLVKEAAEKLVEKASINNTILESLERSLSILLADSCADYIAKWVMGSEINDEDQRCFDDIAIIKHSKLEKLREGTYKVIVRSYIIKLPTQEDAQKLIQVLKSDTAVNIIDDIIDKVTNIRKMRAEVPELQRRIIVKINSIKQTYTELLKEIQTIMLIKKLPGVCPIITAKK